VSSSSLKIQKPTNAKFLLVLSLSVLMTAVFLLLGAPLLRVLRNVFGVWKYWISGTLLTAGLLVFGSGTGLLGLMLFSTWVTIGMYQEFEERGRGNFWTAVLSVLVGSAVLILGPFLWSHLFGTDLVVQLKSDIEAVTQQLSGGKKLSDYGVTVDVILAQLPATLIVLNLTALAFALMLDRRIAVLFALPFEKVASQMRLLEFRVPDVMIWVTMLSFLLSFLSLKEVWVSTVATNFFWVMMGLYFFQGLAVLEVSLLVFRVGSFMRLLIYLLVVGQLFFLLSPVGVIDYWVDFRRRLKKWRLPEKNQKHGENV